MKVFFDLCQSVVALGKLVLVFSRRETHFSYGGGNPFLHLSLCCSHSPVLFHLLPTTRCGVGDRTVKGLPGSRTPHVFRPLTTSTTATMPRIASYRPWPCTALLPWPVPHRLNARHPAKRMLSHDDDDDCLILGRPDDNSSTQNEAWLFTGVEDKGGKQKLILLVFFWLLKKPIKCSSELFFLCCKAAGEAGVG